MTQETKQEGLKCLCRWTDAWYCAKDKGLTSTICLCSCHEPVEPSAAPEGAREWFKKARPAGELSDYITVAAAADFAEMYASALRRENEELKTKLANETYMNLSLQLQVEGLIPNAQSACALRERVRELEQQVKNEREIKEAEKKILIQEIERNTALEQECERLRAQQDQKEKP